MSRKRAIKKSPDISSLRPKEKNLLQENDISPDTVKLKKDKINRFYKFWALIKKIQELDTKDKINIYFSGTVALFTLALVITSAWQIFEYTKATKIDSRAYITVEKVTPLIVAKNSQVGFTVYLKNSGKTPASNVNYRIGVRVGQFLAKASMDTLNYLPLGYGANIGANTEAGLTIFNFTLNDSLVESINTMKSGLFIYGRIDYKDEFEDKHYQTFAVKFDCEKFRFIFIPFGWGGY